MNKCELDSMQCLSLHARRRGSTIELICHQGVRQGCQVNPDLMRSAGVQCALHQTTHVASCQAGEISFCRFAGMLRQVDRGHSQSITWIAPHRGINLTERRAPPGTVRHSKVLTLSLIHI